MTSKPPAPKTADTDFRSEAKKLGKSSLVLLVPTLLTRGANLILIPLYTSVLTPADYGIVAIAGSVQMFLATTLGAATHTSVYRLHYNWDSEDERRKLYGSLMSFLLIVPALIVAVLYGLGALGLFDGFSPLPFRPYLALVLWTSYFTVFQSFPPNLLLVRERAKEVSAFNMVTFTLTVAGMLVFVVALRQGAAGQVRATFASSIAIAVVSLAIMLRFARPTWSWPHLRTALAFSLPLVPDLLATWGLAVSDRLVLEHFGVPRTEIGLYSFAYTVSSVVAVLAVSLARGLQPILTRKLSQNDNVDDVPRLATLALLATLLVALPGAMFAREAIELLTPNTYNGAAQYVPWLVLSVVFQALYYSITQGAYQSKKTGAMPLMTAAALAINLCLNVALVPRLGALAAAISTAVAFFALCVFHALLAHRLHPIPWPYWRWARALLAASSVFLVGELFAGSPWWARLLVKGALLAFGFPAALATLRVFSVSELRSLVTAVGNAVGARLPRKPRKTRG